MDPERVGSAICLWREWIIRPDMPISLAWFGDDAACLDYLDWLRWPAGQFACPFYQGAARWKVNGRWRCAS